MMKSLMITSAMSMGLLVGSAHALTLPTTAPVPPEKPSVAETAAVVDAASEPAEIKRTPEGIRIVGTGFLPPQNEDIKLSSPRREGLEGTVDGVISRFVLALLDTGSDPEAATDDQLALAQ